jgi:hypothetical protein
VTTSAAAIFAYSWLMPSLLYILMRWQRSRAAYEFIEIFCVYGYSLSIYIPVSVLWLVNVWWIQWLLVIVAIVMSGSVLFTTFWPCFTEEGGNKKVAIGAMVLIISFHALLGIGFMLYFFHNSPGSKNDVVTTTAKSVVTTTVKAVQAIVAQNVTGKKP